MVGNDGVGDSLRPNDKLDPTSYSQLVVAVWSAECRRNLRVSPGSMGKSTTADKKQRLP